MKQDDVFASAKRKDFIDRGHQIPHHSISCNRIVGMVDSACWPCLRDNVFYQRMVGVLVYDYELHPSRIVKSGKPREAPLEHYRVLFGVIHDQDCEKIITHLSFPFEPLTS